MASSGSPIVQYRQRELNAEGTKAIAEVRKGVVRIEATSFKKEDGQLFELVSAMSGFVIDAGFIVTCAHGLVDLDEEAQSFRLRLIRITHLGGHLVSQRVTPYVIDTGADLALLALPEGGNPDFSFKLAEDEIMPGQRVFIIGHPDGLPYSMKFGVISNPRREIDGALPNRDAKPADFYLIEMDRIATRGYSGGPVVDTAGNVVSVHHAFSDHNHINISLSVPACFLKKLVQWHRENPGSLFRRGDGVAELSNLLLRHFRDSRYFEQFGFESEGTGKRYHQEFGSESEGTGKRRRVQ